MIALTDALLTVSSVGFSLSLLPAIRDSLRGKTTITLAASVPSVFLLCNTAAALYMLGQILSSFTTLVTAGCWVFLAIQRWKEVKMSTGL